MFIKLLTCLDISKRQLVGLFFFKGIVISLQYIIFTLKKHDSISIVYKTKNFKDLYALYLACNTLFLTFKFKLKMLK